MDCAAAAASPAASNSVRLAVNTAFVPPKCSTNLRHRLGPNDGVSDSASHRR
jgi:hypothetical protein